MLLVQKTEKKANGRKQKNQKQNYTATAIWSFTSQRQPLQQTVMEKLAIYLQKTETRPLSLILYKNQLQMDWRLDVRFKTLKLLQDKIGKTLEYKVIGNYFLNRASIAQETWTMLDKWDCIKLKVSEHYQKKQLVESRENSQNGKKNLLQLFNRDGINIQIHNELKKTK
jgi:hypothetical protein